MAHYVYFGILSPACITSRSSGRVFLQTLLEAAPEWSPDKYNYFEPVNRPFDPANLEEALDAWRLSFFWRRRQPNVHGSVWFGGTIHSSIYIQVAQRAFATESALRLIRELRHHFPIDLAYIYVPHDSDSQDPDRFRRHFEPFVIGLTTHRLRGGLPELPWAMLFGPPYVPLFGRERLLNTPVARIEEISGGVYLQLTTSVTDVTTKRESYLAAQKAARDHLDSNAFLGELSSEPHRVPDFNIEIDEYDKPLH